MSILPRFLSSSIIAASFLLLSQCGTSVYYVRPPDWSEQSRRDSTIGAFSDVFKNVTIFVDPGHGGNDRAGTGPAEDVVEADLNLRVALRLRDYLKQAGANVIISRETDQTVLLDTRAQQANVNNADMFLSIHHNAAPNPITNYTATFYHSRPGAVGYTPSSHDLARYIQRDLAYVMGNPASLASFDGTMSDMTVYPDKGFAVLREAKMSAVLIECGFFTSAYEEQRLKLPEFNDIQAWGIFRGIAKYLKAGIPTLSYASPFSFTESRPKINLQVNDRSDISDESIRVFIDGKEEGFSFNRKTGRIVTTASDELAPGYHRLAAQVRNTNGNSSAPFELFFSIGRQPALLRSTADPLSLPPDESAFSMISVSAYDSSGAMLPDGVPLRFSTSTGLDTTIVTKNGFAHAYVYPGAASSVTFEASNGPVKTNGVISVTAAAMYTRGLVMSSDGKPVGGAVLHMPGERLAVTGETGEYIIAGVSTSGMEITITAPGYFGRREALTDARVQDPAILSPVARGVLHGKEYYLGLASGSAGENPSRLDVMAMNNLAGLLTASGARVVLLDTLAKTRSKKMEVFASQKQAILIQFGVQSGVSKITVKVNGMQSSRALGEAIMRSLPGFTTIGVQSFALRLSKPEEYEKTRQIVVSLPPPGPRSYEERNMPFFSWNCVWAVYTAVLATEGYQTKGSKTVEVRIQDKEKRTPAPFVMVELNQALKAMSDAKGVCRFKAVTISDDDVNLIEPEKYEITGVKTDIVN